MNPTTPPQPASLPDDKKMKRIADEPPVFPCELSDDGGIIRWFKKTEPMDAVFLTRIGYTHWRAIQPEAPKEAPDAVISMSPAARERWERSVASEEKHGCELNAARVIGYAAPSKPAVVAAETKAGQLAEAIGDAFEKHLADAKMSFTPGEEDVIYSALGNALAETVQSKPAVAEETKIVGTGFYRDAKPGTFGRSEWLDLLMACQDGRATCLRVLEIIERETVPVGGVSDAVLIDEMTNAFLRWPLPESVCADLCATHQGKGRVGTNLLSFTEAKQMFSDIVGPRLRPVAAENLKAIVDRAVSVAPLAVSGVGQKTAENLRAFLEVFAEQVLNGNAAPQPVGLEQKMECGQCGGMGGTDKERCHACNGTGWYLGRPDVEQKMEGTARVMALLVELLAQKASFQECFTRTQGLAEDLERELIEARSVNAGHYSELVAQLAALTAERDQLIGFRAMYDGAHSARLDAFKQMDALQQQVEALTKERDALSKRLA